MCHTTVHTGERAATQSLEWTFFTESLGQTNFDCWAMYRFFVPFLIPCVASSTGAAMPGNPHFPLPGGALAVAPAAAVLTNIARVLCDPAHPQPPSSAFILCCVNGMSEELVLSPTLSYFQNSSIGVCDFWSQNYNGFGALLMELENGLTCFPYLQFKKNLILLFNQLEQKCLRTVKRSYCYFIVNRQK